jgi:SAM-dependent methyltransferase
MLASNAAVSSALDRLFSREQGLYGAFEQIPVIAQKGHHRRMELLSKLSIGDVREKVCLDFGTGSWGFAEIFPALHHCRFAYGLDISASALAKSEDLSRSRSFPYGSNFKYVQSDGLGLPLPDGSVDIIFAGESIEHTRFPRRFLSECHRVLSPQGQLIVTTPNRDALLYRTQNDRYCSSPEHFWLFNHEELREFVAEFFEVTECYGFNGSIYRELDKAGLDNEACTIWASMFFESPGDATGIVLRALRRQLESPPRYRLETLSQDRVRTEGDRMMLDLEFGLKGTMIDSTASTITVDYPACDGVILYLWSHAWSGIAEITCDNATRSVNLYAKDSGWIPVILPGSSVAQSKAVIRATEMRDSRAQAAQVIFFEALVYWRH